MSVERVIVHWIPPLLGPLDGERCCLIAHDVWEAHRLGICFAEFVATEYWAMGKIERREEAKRRAMERS